jgi:1-hydroxycarotenoid 3,4-desaturase
MDARVVVVGAGIGGLVAALLLSDRGLQVTVVERANAPGGKMREVEIGSARIDAGPTVLTMCRVFEEIFESVGESLQADLAMTPAKIIARHAWNIDERLDLFADLESTVRAIDAFAGPRDADRYRQFCERAREIYETLEQPFILAERPGIGSLMFASGLSGLPRLWRINPYESLWKGVSAYFQDHRLRQMFARYSTYCGSSPFLAPATLMLIAHVEQQGVWLIEGGMHRLAEALEARAKERGAIFRYGVEAREIEVENGRVAAVKTSDGQRLQVESVIANADVSAIAEGLLGGAATAVAPRFVPSQRSLSAVTWALVAETDGFPLSRHNIFFSPDYAAEFDDILARGKLPERPTVYVCAQDRDASGVAGEHEHERLLCIVNAPANSDVRPLQSEEIGRCEERTFSFLENCGLRIKRDPERCIRTTPKAFAEMFLGPGGALYGRAANGWMASFRRPPTKTRLPGLYLAGGSVHPGPGLPMAAISGRQAATRLLADLASTSRYRRAATVGGTSTRSAPSATKA